MFTMKYKSKTNLKSLHQAQMVVPTAKNDINADIFSCLSHPLKIVILDFNIRNFESKQLKEVKIICWLGYQTRNIISGLFLVIIL